MTVMRPSEAGSLTATWRCPVCRESLMLTGGGRRWECSSAHSFDVAREGYVNLLLAQRRRSRQPGDSLEMVAARGRFLATGAYDQLSAALAAAILRHRPRTVLDVGCGEGRHTRFVSAPVVQGVDVSRAAVAAAARGDQAGWYAVASTADLPVASGSVDMALIVFGPVVAAELARVVRPHGAVVIAHPGPAHLAELRALVYANARPHAPRPPLGDTDDRFSAVGCQPVTFPITVTEPTGLRDLYAMTPYRWHAPRDIEDRLTAAAAGRFETTADIRISVYQRTAGLAG